MKSRALLLTTLGVVMLAFPASSLATASPPSITSAFTPNSIGTGDTSALSYTIVNPNASSLSGIGFTDDLPAGLVVDNPNGTSVAKSCGSASLTASPGGSTITLSGASLPAARTDTAAVTSGSGTVTDANITISDQGKQVIGTGIPALTYVGTVTAATSFLLSSSPSTQVNVAATSSATSVSLDPTCVVSAAVTAATAGVYQNSTGTVTSTEGGNGSSDTESLTVVDPPTVHITTPANGAKYSFGQSVIANYSCQEAANGPGLADCSGDVPDGSPIDTSTSGQHTFEVDAFSNDGEFTAQTVTYTVLPSNQFTVSNINAQSSGRVTLDAKLPGSGTISETETAVIKRQNGQPVAFGSNGLTVTHRGPYGILVALTSQGKQLVHQVHAANHSSHPKHEVIVITLNVTFRPKGGTAKTQTFKGITVTP